MLAGILSVQFGAVISKGLFDEIPPVGMVCLRLMTTSLILLTFVRPRLSGRPMPDWWPVLALGFALGAMNCGFYDRNAPAKPRERSTAGKRPAARTGGRSANRRPLPMLTNPSPVRPPGSHLNPTG